MSHTAEDAGLVLSAIAGPDPRDATSGKQGAADYASVIAHTPSQEITIGLPTEYFSEYADKEMGAIMDQTIEAYRAVPRVRFVNISIPHTKYALATYYIIVSSEVSANMARYDGIRYGLRTHAEGTLEELYRENRRAGLGEEVKRRVMLGTYALSSGYYDAYYARASKVRKRLAEDFEKAFRTVDFILGPTTPTPAFRIGEKSADPLAMYLSDVYTVSANLTGVPAVSYPIGTVRGLPVALQLMGPLWSEDRMLQAAHYLSQHSKK